MNDELQRRIHLSNSFEEKLKEAVKMSNCTQDEDIKMKLWKNFMTNMFLEEPHWMSTAYAITMGIMFFGGLIGNLLTCVVIYSDRTMHTATNYYLFNLAVSDLLVTLAILWEIYLTLHAYDIFGGWTCHMYLFLVLLLWNNGILIITALAVERYLAICYPLMLQSASVLRRVMKVILLIWIIAVIETVPEMWSISSTRHDEPWYCFTFPSSYARYLNGVLALVTFIIPLGIMVFVYTTIAFKVNVVQRDSEKGKIFNHRNNSRKVNRLVLALTLSFVICWLPYFIVRILVFSLDVNQLMDINRWWIVIYRLIGVNGWFNAVLNPLLFSLMSTKFRRALKVLWNKKIKRRNPEYRSTIV